MSFKDKMYQFSQGRYGIDELYYVNLFFVVLFVILSYVFQKYTYVSLTLTILGVILIIINVFRCMSKNISQRSKENQFFYDVHQKMKANRLKRQQIKNDKEHFYKKCPKCKQQLRFKNVKGKHSTKCPKCGNEFIVKI